MNEFILERADVRVLLSHLALYGLGAILEDAQVPDIRLSWTPGMQPRPRITGPDFTAEKIGEVVRDHARARATEPSWLLRDVELRGSSRGLMSPRLTPFDDSAVWRLVQSGRHRGLDLLTSAQAWIDLRQIAALGEPCYWSHNRKGEALQDDGASRLEMQPRNQGSEIVGSRLRKLAHTVGARTPTGVAAGLAGSATSDEMGQDQPDSRTPTGLAAPGPTDNALAWCALWGISQLPLAPRINATASTTGHLGRSRNEWFYSPVWEAPWRTARLRSMLGAQQLKDGAGSGLPKPSGTEETRALAANAWLAARGVLGIIRFPIQRFGSDSAPERRAMAGAAMATTTA